MTMGPDVTGSLAAQMGAVTSDDQVATHPAWTGPGSPVTLDAVLEGPEGHVGVVPEADEAAEDAAEAAEFPAEGAALASGVVPNGFFPNSVTG